MTVLVNVGRRVPRSWFKRQAGKAAGLISFQENLWLIIKQSLNLAKRKANASDRIKFVITKKIEIEDLHYQLEWLSIVIQGNRKDEKEEYEDTLNFYQPLNKLFKKDMPKDKNMAKFFKSKVLSSDKVAKAYKEGYGSINDNNLANKMLEMGILMHAELLDDYDSRDVFYPE